MGVAKEGSSFLMGALLVFVISACGRAVDNMISTTLPLLGVYVFGLGTIYGGIATSVYAASGLFANYVVNPRLSGTARRKALVLVSGLLPVICLLLTVSDAVSAVILGIAASFAFGIIYPSIIATTSLAGGNRGERLLALYSTGLSVSLILGPALESYLLTFSYASVFLAFTAISVVAFTASLKIDFTSTAKETWKQSVTATNGVYTGLLVVSVFFLPFAAFTAFLPIYAAKVFDTSTAVSYTSFIPLFVVSFFARTYMTARPFRRLNLPIIVCTLITAVGILSMVAAPSFLVFLVVMAFLGVPHGVTYILSLIIVSRTSAEGERNAAVSRLSAYSNFLNLLIPLAIGYLIELVGIHLSFLFLLFPVLTSALLFITRYRKTLV